jgi:predicted NBD/HSP70 family sugar kinase
MMTLFDLDLIILAGPSFAAAGSIYQSVIREEVNRRVFARRAHSLRVIASTSGADAAAIGGAVLVLQSELAFLELDGAEPPRPEPLVGAVAVDDQVPGEGA